LMSVVVSLVAIATNSMPKHQPTALERRIQDEQVPPNNSDSVHKAFDMQKAQIDRMRR
jgi:hypothetical protein